MSSLTYRPEKPARHSFLLLAATTLAAFAAVLIAAMPTDRDVEVGITWVVPTQKIVYVQKPYPVTVTPTKTFTPLPFQRTKQAEEDATAMKKTATAMAAVPSSSSGPPLSSASPQDSP